jgi:hypothetical protein
VVSTSRFISMSLSEAALVLAADDARALAGFYAALVDQPLQAGFSPQHWRVAMPASGWLEVYQPSRSRPQPRQRGRLAVCLRRDGDAPVLEAWMEQAIALGAQRLDAPRQEAFGSEVWLLDPEGNGLLLVVRDS